MKKVRLYEEFLNESKDVFPNEIIGNDNILFKKEWEKMNGGKLAAKYNQYFKGYDIDAGGRIFNTVDQLEKYIKATELSNNQYNKYKYMPEIPIKESLDEADGRDTLCELQEMALGQLERIADYANMITARINGGEELESWMFSQLTIALENLNTVHDSMDGNDKNPNDN